MNRELDLFAEGGEAAALMNATDWAATSLGPVERWPASLRVLVPTMLRSRFAMRIVWGPEFLFLYNDGYRPILGASKHPSAMASRTKESFAEVWPIVGPMFERVYGGESVAMVDSPLHLHRNGYLEECYFTLSYSPIEDDAGVAAGVLGVVHETTERVVATRRLRTLGDLAARTAGAQTAEEACRLAIAVLGENPHDVAFARIYLLEGGTPRMVASVGVPDQREIAVDFAEAERHATTLDLTALELTAGPYPEPITRAVITPLHRAGDSTPHGFIVSGVSPRRNLDDAYSMFFQLAAGHVVSALANARALESERKRAEALATLEQQSREERRRLDALFAQAPVAISLVRAEDLRYVVANPIYERIVGRRALAGKTLAEAFPELPADAPVFAMLRGIVASGQAFTADEYCVALDRNGDGKLADTFFLFTALPLRDDAGKVENILTVAVDVTAQVEARKRTEQLAETLRRSEELFRVSQEASPIAFEYLRVVREAGAIVDFTVVYQNAAASALNGLVAGHATENLRLRDLFPDMEGRDAWDHYRAVAESGESWQGETRGSGALHDRWFRVTVVRPDVDAIAITFEEVTAAREQNQERERLYRLAQSERKSAELANRAKDEFLAIVSHELRTPLTAILGWLHLLKSGRLTEEKKARALETIERNARIQAALVEDVLDVSSIITGKLRLNLEPIDFGQVIEAAVETVRPAADARGVRLQVVLDRDAGATTGDFNRLQQVVWNLLSNAVKFTPRGGRVHVTMRRESSRLEVIVADTGRGIAPELLPHVFERFWQADSSTSRNYGGLGLGLAIVRHLVELHGGTIEATSEGVGQGAVFTARLPLSPVRVTTPPHPQRAISPIEWDCPPSLDGLRLLVVDDEADSRDLLQLMLEGCKVRVTTAANAREALELLASQPFDVLLSDIGMPEEDGHALIRRVRSLEDEAARAIPAVALTAFTRAQDRTRALVSGFDSFIAKPVEAAELMIVLANLAGRFRRRSERA